MEKKYIALALLIIGIFLIILSYRNLYSLNGAVFDSTTLNPLPITAHSSNVTNFFFSIKPDLKKVGVYVDNVAGEGWINHTFKMSLRNGYGAEVMITAEAPPSGGYYLFDVPNSWNTLGGVRIYNPEDYAVAVNVEFIFYTQIIVNSWFFAMIWGVLVNIGGIVLIGIRYKKVHTFPVLIRENLENSEEVLVVLAICQRIYNDGEKTFDLCFTNKRLAVFNPKALPILYKQAKELWERVSPIIQKDQEAKKRENRDPFEDLTIDELLEKDKSSYAINYADLDWISLNTSLFGSNITFKAKKIHEFIKLNKEQYKQLSQILPRIDALKGILEINK